MNGEILSPAGSAASVIAAVNGGCDAIYIGGRAFNARRFAQSPSDDELKEIIRQCHLRGVKVHITLNTLYKEIELNDVLSFASKMYSYGADAFIIQDLGFFSLVKNNFPDIAAHASTQLTAHSLSQAKALKELGFERVVLSRELPLNEIRHITAELGAETECFVHGALCVSYSGRCLMSSMLGGRSGNRGSCAQTCRMEYTLLSNNKEYAKGYLLSPKDTCMIRHTGELLDSNITSWKIEGRMKSPEYVSLVTKLYRKYRDSGGRVSPEDMKELTQIFNRGGELGEGCYYSHSCKDMLSSSPKSTGIYIGKITSVKGKSCTIKLTEDISCGDGIEVWTKGEHTGTNISRAAKAGESVTIQINGRVNAGDRVYKSFDKRLADSLKNDSSAYTRRSRVNAQLTAHIGAPLELRLTSTDGVSITVNGAIPEQPLKNSMSHADLCAQLAKTGNTPFILEFDSGECEPLYVPLSSIKELKRTACEELEKAIMEHYTRADVTHQSYISRSTPKADITHLSVQVYTSDQLSAALDSGNTDIYCELNADNFANADELISKAHSKGSRLYFALPVIEREGLHKITTERIKALENTALDGYLARNLTDYATKKDIIADFTLNTFNSASLSLLREKYKRVTLSPELNLKELKPLCGEGTEIAVYGRLPLMTTQHCPVGVHMARKSAAPFCKLKEKHPDCVLKDRKNALFPIITQCEGCNALIFNSAPLYLGNKWEDIAPLKCEAVRLIFTTETKNETAQLIKHHKNLLNGSTEKIELPNSTGGHFYRGVV